MDNLREKVEAVIEKKLADPNVNPDDIYKLSQAYSELAKNDWLKNMTNNFSYNSLTNEYSKQDHLHPKVTEE